MNLIVAVTEDWGIGRNGQLLCSLKEDMRYFREKTRGKTVVMGQKTLESFPGGRPLKGRVNLVLSDDMSFQADGALVFHTPEEILRAVSAYEPDDVFVIGGASVYELFLPWCRNAYVTKLFIRPEADRYFPDLDSLENWELAESGTVSESEGVQYCFTVYQNRSPLALPR